MSRRARVGCVLLLLAGLSFVLGFGIWWGERIEVVHVPLPFDTGKVGAKNVSPLPNVSPSPIERKQTVSECNGGAARCR